MSWLKDYAAQIGVIAAVLVVVCVGGAFLLPRNPAKLTVYRSSAPSPVFGSGNRITIPANITANATNATNTTGATTTTTTTDGIGGPAVAQCLGEGETDAIRESQDPDFEAEATYHAVRVGACVADFPLTVFPDAIKRSPSNVNIFNGVPASGDAERRVSSVEPLLSWDDLGKNETWVSWRVVSSPQAGPVRMFGWSGTRCGTVGASLGEIELRNCDWNECCHALPLGLNVALKAPAAAPPTASAALVAAAVALAAALTRE